MQTRTIHVVLGALALGTLGLSAGAFRSPSRNDDAKPVNVTVQSPADEDHAQMEALIGKVERRLREIDRLLSDAGAGDTSALARVGPSGIDELLKRSKDGAQEVVLDIDRILELARHEHAGGSCKCSKPGGLCQSSGSSGGAPKETSTGSKSAGAVGQPTSGTPGASPLARAGDTTQTREATPSAPGTKPGPGKQPGSMEPNAARNGAPLSPQSSREPAGISAGSAPPGSPREAASPGNAAADRWGDLPLNARDVFRAQGGADLPVRYREWIDAYYKRLNHKP